MGERDDKRRDPLTVSFLDLSQRVRELEAEVARLRALVIELGGDPDAPPAE